MLFILFTIDYISILELRLSLLNFQCLTIEFAT